MTQQITEGLWLLLPQARRMTPSSWLSHQPFQGFLHHGSFWNGHRQAQDRTWQTARAQNRWLGSTWVFYHSQEIFSERWLSGLVINEVHFSPRMGSQKKKMVFPYSLSDKAAPLQRRGRNLQDGVLRCVLNLPWDIGCQRKLSQARELY